MEDVNGWPYLRTALRPSPVILKGKIRVSLFLLMWCKNSCQALCIGQISIQCHFLKLELREQISFLGKIPCGLSASDTTLINFSRWIWHYCSSSSESAPGNRVSGLILETCFLCEFITICIRKPSYTVTIWSNAEIFLLELHLMNREDSGSLGVVNTIPSS